MTRLRLVLLGGLGLSLLGFTVWFSLVDNDSARQVLKAGLGALHLVVADETLPKLCDLGHALVGALLGFLACLLFPRRRRLALFAAFDLLAVIELCQVFTPPRQVSWADLARSALGLAVGYLLWRLTRPAQGPPLEASDEAR